MPRKLEEESDIVAAAMPMGRGAAEVRGLVAEANRLFFLQRNYQAAREKYAKALEQPGQLDTGTVRRHLVMCCLQLKEWKAVLIEVQKLIDAGEETVKTLEIASIAHFQLGDNETCRMELRGSEGGHFQLGESEA